MGELRSKGGQDNVNVTLGPTGDASNEFDGKVFPCQLCSAPLPILNSKVNKPYYKCIACGVQVFVRGKEGISRLRRMANAGILGTSGNEGISHAFLLFNRLQQLELQKDDLTRKRGIIFTDENVENIIQIVDAEIEKVEGELAKTANKVERDK